MTAISRGLIVVALVMAAAAAPVHAADVPVASVQAGVLLVEGTAGPDDLAFGCYRRSCAVSQIGHTVEAGSGCYSESYFQVRCNVPGQAGTPIVIVAHGRAGDDELMHGYTYLGQPDSAFIYGDEGNDFAGGGVGADFIEGGPGDDVLDGQRGDDVVVGGALEPLPDTTGGRDEITGGWDDDVLLEGDSAGESDADTLSGGACTTSTSCRGEDKEAGDLDVVDWSWRSDDLDVDLALPSAEGETLRGIDGVYGGSGADSLRGGDGDSILDGGAGTDHLDGRGGDDLLAGGSAPGPDGRDLIDGGAGSDVVSYEGRAAAVTVRLAQADGQGASGENDRVQGVESIVGGDGADLLAGAFGPNLVLGLAGDDRIDVRGDQGGIDEVDCGDGGDRATTDADDVAHGCELVEQTTTPPVEDTTTQAEDPRDPQPTPLQPATPAMPASPLPARVRAAITGAMPRRLRAGRGGRVALKPLKATCPAAATGPCRVRLTARRGGAAAGRGSASVRAGGRVTPTLRLTAGTQRRLRRAGRLRLAVQVQVIDADGAVTRLLTVTVLRRRGR